MQSAYDRLISSRQDRREVIILSIGWGNVQALRMFFKRCGYSVGTLDLRTTEPPSDIDVLVVPGVGSASAFGGLCEISRRRLIATIQKAEKVVGICLGMHILFKYLREGDCEGLGLVGQEVQKHKLDGGFVTNIGYRMVSTPTGRSSLYFCHSYGVLAAALETVADDIYTFSYPSKKISPFAAGFKLGTLIGLQFHPEKSGGEGLALMKNFLDE